MFLPVSRVLMVFELSHNQMGTRTFADGVENGLIYYYRDKEVKMRRRSVTIVVTFLFFFVRDNKDAIPAFNKCWEYFVKDGAYKRR